MQTYDEVATLFVNGCTKIRSAITDETKSGSPIYLFRPAGTTWIVKRGYVRLVFVDSTGRTLTRQIIGKGAMFGDLPFCPTDSIENEQAFSSGASSLLRLNRRDLEQESTESHVFQTLMFKAFALQYRLMGRRLHWQLISPLRARIATTLYDLVHLSGSRCGHGHLVDVRLTHEELSELVVAARPVVSKLLAELKHEQIIDYTRAHICVLNLQRLLDLTILP